MPHTEQFVIMRRKHIEINTDPRQRSYSGWGFAESEIIMGDWEELETMRPSTTLEKAEEKLKGWVELNDFAVKMRGPSSKIDYRLDIKSLENNNGSN